VATDFFTRQDTARRNTTRLVVLFALAVLAIIVSVDLLLAATMGYASSGPDGASLDYWDIATDPGLVGLAVAGTLVVVGGGSLFKVAQLRAGGKVVAEQLGGRLLHADTSDPTEQQILNVVQEMAIASGTPVPPVYLLDHEPGINAFAAGFTPSDAVIGITRGTAERLTRDELQGVVAHEFSHILNGDMRLNIRLIGILHGILIIGLLGYFVLRASLFSGYRRRGSRDQGGSAMAMLALGAGLTAVGFFGTFFGNLIKAAVSRQREFLADASAVQFTRHPDGIAGALRKIGGLSAGSSVQSPNAPEASHMFFGRATRGFSGMFSTHPPLEERIRRIDPSWDGALPEDVERAQVAPAPAAARGRMAGVSAMASGEGAGRTATAAHAAVAHAVESVGQPSEAHIRYAARLVESLPEPLVSAAHEPYGARAVVYALLLDRQAEPRQQQLAHLADAADPGVYQATRRLAPLVAELDVRARLPLVEIALPALRELTPAQAAVFRQNVVALVRADHQIDLFEWSLHRILLHGLDAHRQAARPTSLRPASAGPAAARTLPSAQAACEVLLSMLAHAGHPDAEGARHAFEQGWQALQMPRARLLPAADLRLEALDAALATLERAAPQAKRRILRAAATAIVADRTVTATEAELLRAISASLGAPMPPLLAPTED
jgi:Zn-dependent protease with chaperone function